MSIRWNAIYDDKSVQTQVAKEIEKGYWLESKLDPFIGTGKNRILRVYPRKGIEPFRPRIKDKLRGDGIKGNTNFDANQDNMEIFSYTIQPEVVGNSLESDIIHYDDLRNIDFAKEAVESLQDWMKDYVSASVFANIVNNFTNVVAAKATDGYQDTTAKSVKELCGKITKDDKLSVKTIQRAISMARRGYKYDGTTTFPIRPFGFEAETKQGIKYFRSTYILFVSGEQAEQLKQDKEWQEMQKQAGARGEDNNIFTGCIGSIEGCVVIDMGSWTDYEVGLPSSGFNQAKFESHIEIGREAGKLADYGGKSSVETSIGVLLGASALCIGMNETPTLYIDKSHDMGRKIRVGIDKILGISKAVYEPHERASVSPYKGQDYGVIGIISAK
ncbi:DUF4043 family protein [Campylobacter sp. 9BO]|uniref:phage capsid family protein n=1 Tax=Campylobacter sp. 9BO TaxID=3424759 RepID=UPI003D33ABB8